MTNTKQIRDAIKGLPENARIEIRVGLQHLGTTSVPKITTADLKALVAENEALKEQVDGLKNAINSALRESADIREGIRTGQARDLVIIDNSFYVIEDGLQIALATHGGNDGQR